MVKWMTNNKQVDEAEEYCQKAFEGGVGHLVSILSAEENQKVQELVDRQKVYSRVKYTDVLSSSFCLCVTN